MATLFLLRDSELNSPIPIHFSSLIPKMSVFTLAISCLATFNLYWFMDLTSIFLCNIVLYSMGLYLHHQSHLQLGIVFTLAPSLHSFWCCFSTDLQQHIEHLPTWGVHLSVSYLFCLFTLFMGFSRQEYWSGLPFPSPVDHILSELSTMTHLLHRWAFLKIEI